MQTSRQRLLEHIRKNRPVSVQDISLALQMTPANVRHHLGILGEQGLVEICAQRTNPGGGRPAHLYDLSQQAQGSNLEQLVEALLEELAGRLNRADYLELLHQAAGRLAVGGLPGGGSPGGSLTRRLSAAVRWLNERHYRARWEAHASGPHLILGHCPYQPLPARHPEMCQLDAVMLAHLLGVSVQQEARLENDRSGLAFCLFTLPA